MYNLIFFMANHGVFYGIEPSIFPSGPIRLPKRSWQWRPPEELKQWADQEFGGVRAAFRVLDKEGPCFKTEGTWGGSGMVVRNIG